MANYILAESFKRAEVQDRLYYCMDDADIETLAAEVMLYFGDKALVLKTGKLFVRGNDNTWYQL